MFDADDSAIEEVCARVRGLMSRVGLLDVPLVVDVGVGNNWDEAH